MRELRGIYPAIVTPFGADGGFDEAATRRIVQHQMAAGVHARLLRLWRHPARATPHPSHRKRRGGGTGWAVVPPKAEVGDPPAVGIWRDVELAREGLCLNVLRGRAKLVAVLSGLFRDTRPIEHIAGRVGALPS